MKTNDELIHKMLNVIILFCIAIACISSILFYIYRDFLSEFPTNGF